MNLFKTLFAAFLFAVAATGFAADSIVDINQADARTLTELKGVGPAKAEAIIAYRDAHGPFVQVEDLAKVQGIGLKTVELNRDRMTVGGAAAAGASGAGNGQ